MSNRTRVIASSSIGAFIIGLLVTSSFFASNTWVQTADANPAGGGSRNLCHAGERVGAPNERPNLPCARCNPKGPNTQPAAPPQPPKGNQQPQPGNKRGPTTGSASNSYSASSTVVTGVLGESTTTFGDSPTTGGGVLDPDRGAIDLTVPLLSAQKAPSKKPPELMDDDPT